MQPRRPILQRKFIYRSMLLDLKLQVPTADKVRWSGFLTPGRGRRMSKCRISLPVTGKKRHEILKVLRSLPGPGGLYVCRPVISQCWMLWNKRTGLSGCREWIIFPIRMLSPIRRRSRIWDRRWIMNFWLVWLPIWCCFTALGMHRPQLPINWRNSVFPICMWESILKRRR